MILVSSEIRTLKNQQMNERRLSVEFQHETVLLHEAVKGLNIKSNGVYVDCTLEIGRAHV